ncbi:MAG: protein kinase [Planctomycetota bacterium]
MADDLLALGVGDELLTRFTIDAVYRGGMGILWAVTDRQTGRPYAVKTIHPSLHEDEEVRAAFEREADTWIALDAHEHLVQALWRIEDKSIPYLVLEYVEGRDLARLLEGGRLPIERALDLAMQCADGMAYAHTRAVPGGVGVVHRDLKPSNLLVTPDDHLRVSDFGLARVFRESVRASGAQASVAGTLAYMAPEQLHGPDGVDRRADVYAFGLVLHEMLAGENPLLARTVPEQIRAVLNQVPAPLCDVPDELRALVARCVAKDREERPRDFPEVLAQLADIARVRTHDWHVDPARVERPAGLTTLVVDGPGLRPRRPRAGEPFALELAVRGDVGPGPVELRWQAPPLAGVEILTPHRCEVLRIDVGGRIDTVLRLRAVAASEGSFALPASTLRVIGPEAETTHAIPASPIDIEFAFHLPLVGREAELEVLDQRIGELPAGRGGLVLIQGESGSGRSRMLHEVARRTAAANIRSVLSRAEGESERPLRLLNDTARELLSISRGASRSVRAAVNAVLGSHPGTARYFAEILLGGMPRDNDLPVVQHWHTLLAEATRAGPLVLLLDDLHRADEAVARICFEMAARAQEANLPVLVVATVSTEQERRLDALHELVLLWERRDTDISIVELDPLTEEDVALLVAAVFEGHTLDEDAPWLVPTLSDATQGNAFHLAEILRMLRGEESGGVAQIDGEWRVQPGFSPESLRALVPHELASAVRQRIESLGAGPFATFALAALLGEEFDPDVLRTAVGDDEAFEGALADWERRGLVRPSDESLERYRFWSSVVPTVAERMLEERSADDVATAHGRIADAMIEVYAEEDRRARRALSIAHHLQRAGRPVESLPFTLIGCQRLVGLALSARAREILERSNEVLELDAVDEKLRARFEFLYGIACEDSGAYEQGRAALLSFLRRAADLGDFRRRDAARAYRRLGRIYQAQGAYEEAALAYETSRAMLLDVGDYRAVAFLYCSLGALALERGELAGATRAAADARRLAEERGNEGAAIQARILEGYVALRLNRLGEARTSFHDAESRARELGDRRRHAMALQGLARVDLENGYVEPALGHLREAIDLAAVMGDRAGLADSLLLLGAVHRDRGRTDLALQNFRRSLRVYREIGRPEGEAEALQQAGRLLRMRAKTAPAVRDLAAASEIYGQLQHPQQASALWELAVALVESGADRPARLALARADRGLPRGAARRAQRVLSRAVRARMALARGDLARARGLAQRARKFAARLAGHGARIVAYRIAAEVALRGGDLHAARRDADTAVAFARESGFLLESAAAERVLLELAARAGRRTDASERAHRIARIYAQRGDVGGEPWRLLAALARGFLRTDPRRAAGYARAAARCRRRLLAQGFRVPE